MSEADPYLGRTIDGRYIIHRLLGKGGMGAVYEARHTVLDRRVAVKFMLRSASADDVERFRREARTAARIDHENVAHIYDTGSDGDVSFIVMELVDGIDLRRLIANDGPLAPARAVELTRQILQGLHAIHDAGIVHRDIKPANLVLTRDGAREVIKIMDFGISKSHEPGLTRTGSVVGTPEYMAPEQQTGRTVDHRADLYAVGVTLHVMLTGDVPSEARTIGPASSTVPPEIAPVLDRALARSAADRFASAREFAAALADPARAKTVVETAPTATAPTVRETPPAKEAVRRRRWPIIAAAFALAAIAAIAWQLTRTRAVTPTATSDAGTDGPIHAMPDAGAGADAGIDAAIVTSPREAPVDASVVKPKPTGLYCMCVDAVSLCPSKAKAPLCQCRDARGGMISGGRVLCPEPAPGGKCPVAGYDKKVSGKQPSEPCEGYFNTKLMQGIYSCTWCQGVDLRAFRGKPFDVCSAFDRHTGERKKGVLDACTPDREPVKDGER